LVSSVEIRILEVLRSFVSDVSELHAVERGEPILDVLSLDSVTVVELVSELEKAFGVHFDYETIEDAFETIHTLGAFLAQASSRRGEAGR
jgi:acyl carrier protein